MVTCSLKSIKSQPDMMLTANGQYHKHADIDIKSLIIKHLMKPSKLGLLSSQRSVRLKRSPNFEGFFGDFNN
jgi:hypothetical protein